MRFSDGFWLDRPGLEVTRGRWAHGWRRDGDGVSGLVTPRPTDDRSSQVGQPALRVRIDVIAEGVLRLRVQHHLLAEDRRFIETDALASAVGAPTVLECGAGAGVGRASGRGRLIHGGIGVEWTEHGRFGIRPTGLLDRVAPLGPDAVAHVRATDPASAFRLPGVTPHREGGTATDAIRVRLPLAPGELMYGLGERFGPVVANGQSMLMWNADGGTSSDQQYKTVPLLLSSRGYGIFVNDSSAVSVHVAAEVAQGVQVAVEGEGIELWLIAGPTPKDVLRRYTGLLGRPPAVPDWSLGLWLSTSFLTDYSEATAAEFIDGMAERGIPLSVFHFDSFWMSEMQWCDFAWDERQFPDPRGMLRRLRERGLRVSVWINPYLSQHSPLFDQAVAEGYVLRRPDGRVWQWDLWQPGMAIVDMTNPDAVRWFQDRLRPLVRQGVHCMKTDFGERIPTDAVFHDGSSGLAAHNRYSLLYNRAVAEVLREEHPEGRGLVFARAATAGGQAYPVHWGGDNTASFESMAETLRGGLSLAWSGFAYWSHDIGGFEGHPDAAVFARWVPFGLLSSHSRLHGSASYRVPWEYGDEAVAVLRRFARLKCALGPYLRNAMVDAVESGTPLLRPMAMEFPADPATAHLDRQYMLGTDLLVAPVFAYDGSVEYYVPEGQWIGLLDGVVREGARWHRETHPLDSLPLLVREGAIIPLSANDGAPGFDPADGIRLIAAPTRSPRSTRLTLTAEDGTEVLLRVDGSADGATVDAVSSAGPPPEVQVIAPGAEVLGGESRGGESRGREG